MPPRTNAAASGKAKRSALAHKKQNALFIEFLSLDPPRGGERDGQMARADDYWDKVTAALASASSSREPMRTCKSTSK